MSAYYLNSKHCWMLAKPITNRIIQLNRRFMTVAVFKVKLK